MAKDKVALLQPDKPSTEAVEYLVHSGAVLGVLINFSWEAPEEAGNNLIEKYGCKNVTEEWREEIAKLGNLDGVRILMQNRGIRSMLALGYKHFSVVYVNSQGSLLLPNTGISRSILQSNPFGWEEGEKGIIYPDTQTAYETFLKAA